MRVGDIALHGYYPYNRFLSVGGTGEVLSFPKESTSPVVPPCLVLYGFRAQNDTAAVRTFHGAKTGFGVGYGIIERLIAECATKR